MLTYFMIAALFMIAFTFLPLPSNDILVGGGIWALLWPVFLVALVIYAATRTG